MDHRGPINAQEFCKLASGLYNLEEHQQSTASDHPNVNRHHQNFIEGIRGLLRRYDAFVVLQDSGGTNED